MQSKGIVFLERECVAKADRALATLSPVEVALLGFDLCTLGSYVVMEKLFAS